MTGPAERRPQPVVDRAALLASGQVPTAIRRSVRTGELERVTRGWYRAGPVPGEEQQALDRPKSMLRRAPSLIGSHESAALVHGLPLVYADLGTVHLTRDGRTGARRSAGRTLHARPLLPAEVVKVRGLRVTAVPRTLIDLGCSAADPRTVVGAADGALHTGRLSPEELGAALLGAGHRIGLGRARVLLEFADGREKSVGESVLRWLMVSEGLPLPEPQVKVYAPDGTFLGRVDLAYVRYGVAIEFDGFVKYQALLRPGQTASQVVVEEKQREDRLREAGVIVIRFVWADFKDPAAVVTRMLAAVRQGQRASRAGLLTATLISTPPKRASRECWRSSVRWASLTSTPVASADTTSNRTQVV